MTTKTENAELVFWIITWLIFISFMTTFCWLQSHIYKIALGKDQPPNFYNLKNFLNVTQVYRYT